MSLVMAPIESVLELSPISFNRAHAGHFFFGPVKSFRHPRASNVRSPARVFLLDSKKGEADHLGKSAHGTASLLSPILGIECFPSLITVTTPPEANAIKGPPTLFGDFFKGMPDQFEVDETVPSSYCRLSLAHRITLLSAYIMQEKRASKKPNG
jgi:hypothetical protein